MRILISLVLAGIVLTLPLTVIAAPSRQGSVDIKTIALTKSDLQRGFEPVTDRTVSEERPDGVAVYDVTFARERTAENLASGPFEVRSGVARTAQVDEAARQLESTKEAFIAEGWAETGVPALGDEALGLTQTTDAEGGKIAHFSYLFRKNAYIVMVGVRGRPDVVKLSDAVGLAIIVSGRLDSALAGVGAGPAAAAPGGPAGGATTQQSAGERAKVVGVDGGSVNMRSEPSTSAEIVAQVAEGATLDVIGPDREAEGRTWRNVRNAGQSGWIAATYLESVAAPAAPAAPPAAPSPSPQAVTPAGGATEEPVATEPTTGSSTTAAGAPAAATATPTAAPQSDLTFRGQGNGLVVEATMLSRNLSSGIQQVKVKVTRNGGGVEGAFVNVTAKLTSNARLYRSFKADRTNRDGFTEITWDMEGPAGEYELLVEARLEEQGTATTAKSTFRWK